MERRINKKQYLIILSLTPLFLALLSSTAFSAIELKYEGWEMRVEARISEMYHDNLTFTKEDKVGELLTTFSLSMNVDYTGRRRGVGLAGHITRWFRNDDFDEVRGSENLQLRLRYEFSEYDSISLEDSFAHSRYPMEFEEEFGRFTAEQDVYSNRVNLNYSREISEHFRINTNYTNGIYWTSESTSGDSIENGIGLYLDYLHSAATSASLGYNYSTREFEESGNVSVNSINTGLRHYITQRLSLDGRVGLTFVSPADDNDFTASSFDISLTNEIDARTTGRLSFSKGVHTTLEGDVFSSWQVSASLNRQFLENLNGSVSGFYGEGDFTSIDVRDKFLGASGGLNYIFGKHLTGNIGYTYSNLNSTNEDRGYISNVISSGVTLTF